MRRLYSTIIVMLFTALSASLAAAPIGYSINSDSGSGSADGLYRIDLVTGEDIRIGTVPPIGLPRIDIEGLAFAPNGTLYGVDDDSLKLFPIDTGTAAVINSGDVNISGLPSGGSNDFGMTFACDGTLYITTVAEQSLYRLGLDGKAELVGALGYNISAIAAYGNNPVELYGLGNGLNQNREVDSPSLFRIDPANGAATEIGLLGMGNQVGDYTEGGLSFDDSGQLWAITDRAQLLTSFPSQVMKVNKITGVASDVRDTAERGFESLAIAVPQGCATPGPAGVAEFTVESRFADGNDITPVRFNIQCNTGLPLQQSVTTLPDQGFGGSFEVKFVVDNFADGELDCSVWADTLDGYRPEYECQANNSCSTNNPVGQCTFENVGAGENNLCLIQNYVEPVEFTVNKQWLYDREDHAIDSEVKIDLECANVVGGDGTYNQGGMRWSWLFSGDTDSHTAILQPDFNGNTQCRAVEQVFTSAIESDQGCATWDSVELGDDAHECTVTNTVFFEGIPTLSQYGLILFAGLMLLTGLAATRRL
jgi:hypothetical protein